MVSAPIWAVVALLQSWLLAGPGDDVRLQDPLWSVRPADRRITTPRHWPEGRRTGNPVPALAVELRLREGPQPRAIAPIRTDDLRLCDVEWSPAFVRHLGSGEGWLRPTSLSARLPIPASIRSKTFPAPASTLREREVDAYLGDLRWRQPTTLWTDRRTDGPDAVPALIDLNFGADHSDQARRLGLGERFDGGTVAWSRYLDDAPDRAFVREMLNSMGLPDGIYWNKAVFLPMAGVGSTTYWLGVNMSLRW